jgi:hypothetical protein
MEAVVFHALVFGLAGVPGIPGGVRVERGVAMRAQSICRAGLILFIVLSVTDLVQTYVLIQGTGGRVYEANPVAGVWLLRYGWLGLVVFKAGVLFVFVASVAVLMRHRPRASAWVVVIGCLVLALVTLYSRQLLNG